MDNWMYQPSRTLESPPQPTGVSPPPAATANANAAASASREETVSPETRAASNAAHQSRVRRRNRTIASCLECRRRKLKCDKQAPCSNCTRFKRDCLYLASALDPASQQKLADIKEKMGALERNLEREVAGQSGPQMTSQSSSRNYDVEGGEADDAAVGGEEEDNLEVPPYTAVDNVYGEDGDDDIVDLGIQIGRMRLTERVGGWVRPRLASELTLSIGDSAKNEEGTPNATSQSASLNGGAMGQTAKPQFAPKSYIGPGPDYIAPSSSFLFPGTNMNTSLLDYLPSKKAADQLIAHYYQYVHPLCTTVHLPTFQAAYSSFWEQIAMGMAPTPSRQAVIFAALFSAAVSLSEEDIMHRFGTTKASLVDSLRSGTEFTLCKANLLRATKFETMQAFVMYLIPQIRGEVSRAHSAMVGTAIRLAECMGLHRDGTHYNMSAVEVQVRRLVWHQLCFLDIRTCEATGPRPQIRLEDYDTQYPWNVNEIDLVNATVPPTDKFVWTDATFPRLRAETMDVRRQLWNDCALLDKKKKSLTSVLIKVQKIRSSFTERFSPLLDDSVPFQKLAKEILRMFLNGVFITVLHRYIAHSVTTHMPDRLRQVLIESAVEGLEATVELDVNPALKPWSWYRGAFNQYHVALLLLIEIYDHPYRKEAPRIWKSLDFVFDVPSHLPPKQKGDLILTDLRDCAQIYQDRRKVRTTTQQDEMFNERYGEARTASNPTGDAASAAVATQGNNVVAGGPTPPMMPPIINFSPSPQGTAESDAVNGRNTSVSSGTDAQMMEDIDWAEWNKYFPVESNTGNLNIPDFDFADYTAGYGAAPLDTTAFSADLTKVQPGLEGTNFDDFADVQFMPTLVPKQGNEYPGNWMGM